MISLVVENAAVSNDNGLAGPTSAEGAEFLNSFENIETLDNLTEDDVIAIEPGGLLKGDKELGAVCVATSVGH